jgi:hypothetical protein
MGNPYDDDYQRMIDDLANKARREREQEDDKDLAEKFRIIDEKTIEELRKM